MVVNDVINLAAILGSFGIIVISLLFVFGYFVIYKRLMKGQKSLPPHRLILSIVLITYLFIVLGATILIRSSDDRAIDLQLFTQYRSAWYHYSITEWHNIILNIAMFVPFGILLPLLSTKLRSAWKVTIICLLGTLFIETSQLLTHRGTFATDDIVHNTLGGLIGYGVYNIAFMLISRRFKIKRFITAILPLFLTVSTFFGIYIAYELAEYGIITETYVRKIDMRNLIVSNSSDLHLSSEPVWADIYTTVGLTSEEQIYMFAEDFYSRIGAEIDHDITETNKESTYFYARSSTGEVLCLGVRHLSMTYTYEDFSASDYNKAKANEQDIRNLLEKYEIFIPEKSRVSEGTYGSYRFDTVFENTHTLSQWGWLECEYYEDDSIKLIYNNIVECDRLRAIAIISEQAAYEQIINGMFHYDADISIHSLHITSVQLTYCMDTKGFLQPMYCFDAVINGNEEVILIPAL